jgi:hypothetical protein
MKNTEYSHPLSSKAMLALLAVIPCLLLLVVPAIAEAATTRLYEGSIGKSSTDPEAIAVDQANGDIYAYYPSDNAVERFTAAGSPHNFTAGPHAGTNKLVVFTLNPGHRIQIAVDNSGGPTGGDVFVAANDEPEADKRVNVVEIFSPNGENVGTITGATAVPEGKFLQEGVSGVAIDQSNGDLYLSQRIPNGTGNEGKIWRYSPRVVSGQIDDFDYSVTGITTFLPQRLAADSGRVYAVTGNSGTRVVREFSVSEFVPGATVLTTGTVLDGGGSDITDVTNVAVDRTTGDVYVDEGSRAAAFDSSGLFLYHFAPAGETNAKSAAIAVRSASSGPAQKVYISDSVSEIAIYGEVTAAPKLTYPKLAEFGEDGTEGSSFLNERARIAIDPSHSRLYVIASNATVTENPIYGFDISAAPTSFAPVPAFAPLQFPATVDFEAGGLAVNQVGSIFVSTGSRLYGLDSNGAMLGGGFPVDPSLEPGPPVGSPTRTCGAVVDSAGHIWVTNRETDRVLEYDSTGAYVGSFPTIVTPETQRITIAATSGQFRLKFGTSTSGDLAFDASAASVQAALEGLPSIGAGNVTVSGGPGGASPYLATFQGSLAKTDVPEIAALAGSTPLSGGSGASVDTSVPAAPVGPCQLTRNAEDDLYVGTGTGVWKYSAATGYATGTQIAATRGAANPRGLASDLGNDHLFVARNGGGEESPTLTWVDDYSAAGALVGEFNLERGSTSGVAVDPASHYIYVYGGKSNGPWKVTVYGPGALLPEARTLPASGFTNNSAVLNGAVVNQGVSLTECHFEYVAEDSYRATGFADLSSGGSVPCSPAAGAIPPDLQEHPVSATAIGLTASTRYRYRLLATNSDGSVTSPAGTFESAGPPLVETTGSALRTSTSATLAARVDPSREATSYHFEYGVQGPCDANPCESTPARSAGAGNLFRFVEEPVGGLGPSTTLHYRIVADNGNPDGPAYGQDQTIVTRATDELPARGHFAGPPGSDRAWEQVNLPDTGGNPIVSATALGFSRDGDRAVYQVFGGTPISDAGNVAAIYFAQRPEGEHPGEGWQSKLITPARAELTGPAWNWLRGPDDLSTIVAQNTATNSTAHGRGMLWQMTPNGQPTKLFDPVPPQELPDLSGGGYFGVSGDSSTVVLELNGGVLDPAFPGAAANLNLYDVSAGRTPELVSLLPGGVEAPCGVKADPKEGPLDGEHWISFTGSQILFGADPTVPCAGPFKLYMRDRQAGQTVDVAGVPLAGPDCAVRLIKRTAGSVFFTTASQLDPNDAVASACEEGNDVYRYDVGSGDRTCVTCVSPGRPAEVIGTESREISIAEDGSRIYFRSGTPLLPGAPADEDGEPAIYRIDPQNQALAYVAPGGEVQVGDFAAPYSTITPDGSTLVFRSKKGNLNALGGRSNGGTSQYYEYDDENRSLTCISCPANGQAPVGAALTAGFGAFPLGPDTAPLALDGTYGFSTPTPLVDPDQNTPKGGNLEHGVDAYEWRDGRQLLVTDGLTRWPKETTPAVAGISRSGRDLFFIAPAQYTADALDAYTRLYDARIGGGIDFPPSPTPCALEVCQGTPKGPPAAQPPGTGTYQGPGNPESTPLPCRRGKVRRHGHCVKKQRKAKRHRRPVAHGRGGHR